MKGHPHDKAPIRPTFVVSFIFIVGSIIFFINSIWHVDQLDSIKHNSLRAHHMIREFGNDAFKQFENVHNAGNSLCFLLDA